MNSPLEHPVAFQSGPMRLQGVLGLPSTPGPDRTGVVLIHGWAGNRGGPHRLLVQTARALNKAGVATLRFDLRGRGDSEGEPPATSLDDMIWDTVAAADFLEMRASVTELVLLGICSGSNVAIGAATFRPRIRTLALWSTLPFQPEQRMRQRLRRARHYLREYALKALRPATWRRLLRGRVDLRAVGRTVVGERRRTEEGRDLKDSERDIMADFSQFSGRALFVTGSDDPEGMEGHKLFSRFIQGKPFQAAFHVVKGATHSYYSSDHSREVARVTFDFLGLPADAAVLEGA
jgi:pimeloyl-ACP methyl ester carboxylesterase